MNLSSLADPGLAADSSVKAKAKPIGQGKMDIAPSKNDKSALSKSVDKSGKSPKFSTPKSGSSKSNVKSASSKKQIKPDPNSGSAWRFGTGRIDKKAATERWQRGLNSANLRKRAIVDRKEPLPEVTEEDMIVNPLLPREKKKSAFNLGFEHKGSSWNNGPSGGLHNPGEDYLMEGSNVIRGTTSVEAGKDLNIDLGPELILKDQKARENMSNSSQPDSTLGIGVQFKFGF